MSQDPWMTCDGIGNFADRPLSRRSVLAGTLGLVGVSKAIGQLKVVSGSQRRHDRVLVVLFLRGGADGLAMVPPYGEDAYLRNRPSLGLPVPGKGKRTGGLLDLDGFFGLHPSLNGVFPLFREGALAMVHAVGSADKSRSHFEAMRAMELGQPAEGVGPKDGWLSRYLANNPQGSSPIRALALTSVRPDSLLGYPSALTLRSLDELRLGNPEDDAVMWLTALEKLYAASDDEMARAGRETLHLLRAIQGLDLSALKPEHGAVYPESELGSALRQVAVLVRSDLGLEVACLDKGGWDTHVGQGTTTGWMPTLMADLGNSLAAFMKDLGSESQRVTVLVQTEFGRRVRENTGLGTDHGKGGVAFLLGGGVKGGRVYGKWPGLEESDLDDGDLKPVNDYRRILSEVCTKRLMAKEMREVFPSLNEEPLGLIEG